MKRAIVFIRGSTAAQDGKGQKLAALRYCTANNYKSHKFVELRAGANTDETARAWKAVVSESASGDFIIIFELSRIGRTVRGILENIQIAQDKGVQICEVVNNRIIGIDIESKITTTVFALVAEIEHSLIKERTTAKANAMKADIKSKGHYLTNRGNKLTAIGRPKGSTKPPKLMKHIDEIMALVKQGVSQAKIADMYKTTRQTMNKVIQLHNAEKAIS